MKAADIKKNYGHDYSEEKLDLLAIDLEHKLSNAIADRYPDEERMMLSLQIYNGQYDAKQLQDMKDAGRSTVYIKIARMKTNVGEGQMSDILFPTSESNFHIEPTPVPDLVADGADEPITIGGMQFQDKQGNVITGKDINTRKKEMADEACKGMFMTIKDQLAECNYEAEARQALHDACKLGTGIVKGPVVKADRVREFKQMTDGTFKAVYKTVYTPVAKYVFTGNFFPDMSASKVSECEFIFERSFMSRQEMKDLLRSGSKVYNKNQLKKVLDMQGDKTQHRTGATDDIRTFLGFNPALQDTRYEVWEYHGAIDKEVLEELTGKEQEDDAYGVLFYCGGIVFGARIYPMEYEQRFPYSVFNWERNESSIFGYSIPELLKDESEVMNASWRMTLDNGAIASGPQIGVDRKNAEPHDGKWEVRPFKLWNLKGNKPIDQVFTKMEFNSHIGETITIYDKARQLADEVSGMPMLQQGESTSPYQQVGALSLLMNAANTVRRRQVKDWDDNMTTPLISDFYAFNMEWNSDPKIKGDFKVVAKGVSALLAREQHAIALNNFIAVAGSNPVLQPVLALRSRQIVEAWVKTQRIPGDLVPTEEELNQYIEQQKQNPPKDPQVQLAEIQSEQIRMKHENEMKRIQMENDLKAAEAEKDRQLKGQLAMVELERIAAQERIAYQQMATQQQISQEELVVRINETNAKLNDARQKFLAEVQIKQAEGPTSNYGLTDKV